MTVWIRSLFHLLESVWASLGLADCECVPDVYRYDRAVVVQQMPGSNGFERCDCLVTHDSIMRMRSVEKYGKTWGKPKSVRNGKCRQIVQA